VAPMGHRVEAQVAAAVAPSKFESPLELSFDSGVSSSGSPDAEMRDPGYVLGFQNLDIRSR
jgi:hypothetical protein